MDSELTIRELLRRTRLLTGLDPDAVADARDQVAAWGMPHVSSELLAPTADAAVSAFLLVAGIQRLVVHGAERAKLLAKLRRDPEGFWSTWAEIRAADLFVRMAAPDVEITLEARSAAGAHADFRLLPAGQSLPESVEVKAVGLSDEEVAFCQRAGSTLDTLIPREGIGTLHAPLEMGELEIPRARRRDLQRAALRASRRPANRDVPAGLAGVSIVAHGSESHYVRRVTNRLLQLLRQLPQSDECWAAFYWSNGASITQLTAAIPWSEIPSHVQGISFVGSGVAFPHPEIHHFQQRLPRDAHPESSFEVQSTVDGDFAARVIDRFDRSSGVRAILLRGNGEELVRRDGRLRILPYNLLLDPDPEGISGGRRQPSTPRLPN